MISLICLWMGVWLTLTAWVVHIDLHYSGDFMLCMDQKLSLMLNLHQQRLDLLQVTCLIKPP